MGLLGRHGIHWGPRPLLDLALLLQAGLWASLLGRIERWRFGALLERTPVPDDPVFIVGHWRSGTTLLHQLLAADPRLAAPTLYHCTWPGCIRTARPLALPLMRLAVRGTRPMDAVRMSPDEPQEDEWALLRLTGRSPLEGLLFPRSPRYFLLDAHPGEAEGWLPALEGFLTAVALDTGARLVLKNPLHGLRIPALAARFPRARFVHLVRDPHRVVPSAVHLWAITGADNALTRAWAAPTAREVALGLARYLDEVDRALCALPAERWTELRFEDLEADPHRTLDAVYAGLGMERDAGARRAQQALIQELAGYRKNTYPPDPGLSATLAADLAPHCQRYDYRS